jgi:hypothetical protein
MGLCGKQHLEGRKKFTTGSSIGNGSWEKIMSILLNSHFKMASAV